MGEEANCFFKMSEMFHVWIHHLQIFKRRSLFCKCDPKSEVTPRRMLFGGSFYSLAMNFSHLLGSIPTKEHGLQKFVIFHEPPVAACYPFPVLDQQRT